MLKIKDLAINKELQREEMVSVVGGWDPMAIFDGSTTLKNKVADVDQLFNFNFNQANAGALTNNQAINGGNGLSFAPVDQTMTQNNSLTAFDIGNTSVS